MLKPARSLRIFTMLAILVSGCARAGAGPSTQAGSVPLFFDGARIIVGDGTVIESGAFIVSGGRISQLGQSGLIVAPDRAARFDLRGKTVMPAMIAGHVHLGFEGYTSWGADRYDRDNVIDHLHRLAYYGFGAAYSAGTDPHELARSIQQDQAAGSVGGARIVWAVGMAPPGQGPNPQLLNGWRDAGMPSVVLGVASVDEARRKVREVAADGGAFIKIWVDDRGGAQEKLRPELYGAIIEEATRHGIPVHAHQQSRDDMEGLLRAGVSGFLHGRISPQVYDDEMIRLLVERDAFVVPNLGLGELRREANQFDDPFLQETVRSDVIDRLRASAGNPNPISPEAERTQREVFQRMLAAGVEIMLGSDAGAVPDHFFGYADHRELEIFVRLGMTPMQAIVAATRTPAARFGLAEQGTLEVGKTADFIVLDANPLDDIRNTRRIADVYLRGDRIDRAALRASWTEGAN